jgi:Tol biopolymer transport system component
LDKPLGNYTWSPDGERLAFDNLTYIATGEESIFIRQRESNPEIPFSPDPDPGYAALPAFSPQGDQIAYLAELSEPESQRFTLIVQGYPNGEARQLGEFGNVNTMNWSPEGNHMIFNNGPWGHLQVVQVDLLDRSSTILAGGMQPSQSAVS